MYEHILSQNGTYQLTLVPSAIKGREPKTIVLNVYADMTTVIVKTCDLPGNEIRRPQASRGKITRGSRKSRKRMIDNLAQKRDYQLPIFGTLTYADEAWFGMNKTNQDLQRDLTAFKKRVLRAFPRAGMFWRKEWENRKSGDYVGKRVPHVHFILDGVKLPADELQELFTEWWSEIITKHDTELLIKGVRVDVQIAKSRRHAMYYVSKYVAKIENPDNSDENPDNSDICQPVDRSSENSVDSIGRIWGVCGIWDKSKAVAVVITYRQYVEWKRLIVRWLKSKGSRYTKKLSGLSPHVGSSVYGLGDMSHAGYEDLYDSAAFRLLLHVQNLA